MGHDLLSPLNRGALQQQLLILADTMATHNPMNRRSLVDVLEAEAVSTLNAPYTTTLVGNLLACSADALRRQPITKERAGELAMLLLDLVNTMGTLSDTLSHDRPVLRGPRLNAVIEWHLFLRSLDSSELPMLISSEMTDALTEKFAPAYAEFEAETVTALSGPLRKEVVGMLDAFRSGGTDAAWLVPRTAPETIAALSHVADGLIGLHRDDGFLDQQKLREVLTSIDHGYAGIKNLPLERGNTEPIAARMGQTIAALEKHVAGDAVSDSAATQSLVRELYQQKLELDLQSGRAKNFRAILASARRDIDQLLQLAEIYHQPRRTGTTV